ncbi:MAG: hypothetical protein Q9M30_03040 [Mariprofundaceae bacterium]|nr:hypothetical protein [Mariprofundaceae bacterium]
MMTSDIKASDIKASFNLEHDQLSDTVSIHPSVQSLVSARVDYLIRAAKKGVAGTSVQKNRGHLELKAGEMVDIGPLLSFGSVAAGDALQLELHLCGYGTRCKIDKEVIAVFTSSYPDSDGTEK